MWNSIRDLFAGAQRAAHQEARFFDFHSGLSLGILVRLDSHMDILVNRRSWRVLEYFIERVHFISRLATTPAPFQNLRDFVTALR